MFNYWTKSDLKSATWINASAFDKSVDLASLKSDILRLNVCKLEAVPTTLNKLSNVVKNDVFKKTVYDELKQLMSFRLLILVIYWKKVTMT